MKIGQQKNVFFAGDFLPGQQTAAADRIAAKKGLCYKQGMRAVTGVNDSEKRMDQSMEEIKERVNRLMEENEEADRRLQEANQKMAQAKVDYQIDPDSQEEKDLDLLKKKFDIEHHRTFETLTEEEEKRLAEMGEPTEYQALSMEAYEQADHWKYTIILENKKEMRAIGSVTRHVKLMRLESHAMEDAMRAKEEMMESAAKEAVGILTGEAVDTIDQNSEDVKAEAEAKQEQKEEQEEQIEAAREQKEEEEAVALAKRKNASERVEQALMSEISTDSMDAEIQKILEEEKMLEEELKGLRVNMGI